MASNVIFDNPPIQQGSETEQLVTLYRYLQTMSEKLNEALMTVSMDQLAPEVQVVIRDNDAEKVTERVKETQKSLILKTARIVRTSMDEIRATLQTHVDAISEQYGELESTLTNQILANAEGIQMNFERIETIRETGEENAVQIDNYLSYIHAGIIGHDNDLDKDITGIAIGEGVTNPDGTVNLNNAMATFTAEKLAFYQGGAEVGYYANNTFHIDKGEVTTSMQIGNHIWKRLSNGALALLAGE